MLTVFLFPITKNYAAYNKEEGVFKNPVFFSQIVWTFRFLCGIVLCYRRYKEMNVIKELWHGNIVPQEDSRTNTKDMKEPLAYIARHHENLYKTFTPEQKELYEKLHDCWDEYVSLAEAAIFEYAFKLGMQIAIETLAK